MTVQDLARLITTYGWLTEELAQQARAGAGGNCAHIRADMDALFLKIVQFPADNPRIACAQIAFLVSAMGEMGRDDQTRAMLARMTLAHVQRLSETLGRTRRDALPRERETRQGGCASGDSAGRYSLRTGSA